MVVGGEQHVKACGLCAGGDSVRAVEHGIAGILIAVVGAAEGGFQIGDGIVSGRGIGGQIAENAFKIVAAVALGAGVDDRLVHQQVAGGGDGGGCHNSQRLGLSGRLGFCGIRLSLFPGIRGQGFSGDRVGSLKGCIRLGRGTPGPEPHRQSGASAQNKNHQNNGQNGRLSPSPPAPSAPGGFKFSFHSGLLFFFSDGC